MESDPHVEDGELVIRPLLGFAYQKDLTPTIQYDEQYLENFIRCDLRIKAKIMAGRVALVSRHLSKDRSILDYGCGSGSFVEHALAAGYEAKGFEVNPESKLILGGLYAELVESFDAVCAWDVIEHLPSPLELLRRVQYLFFCALPIFDDLTRIRESKHYKPGEHLWHWTDSGFVHFIAEQGFELLERSTHEVQAGREQIGAYAFRRVG